MQLVACLFPDDDFAAAICSSFLDDDVTTLHQLHIWLPACVVSVHQLHFCHQPVWLLRHQLHFEPSGPCRSVTRVNVRQGRWNRSPRGLGPILSAFTLWSPSASALAPHTLNAPICVQLCFYSICVRLCFCSICVQLYASAASGFSSLLLQHLCSALLLQHLCQVVFHNKTTIVATTTRNI